MTIQVGILKLIQREPFSKGWVWQDTGGAPISLVGARARAECRSYQGRKLLFAFSSTPASGEGSVVLGGLAGTIDLSMTGLLTATIAQGGPFDLFVWRADNIPVKFASGVFQVRRVVTSGGT